MKQLPRIDQALSQATEAGEVAGVVAAATARGEPFYEGAFGRREIGKPAAMTADTVFWIASMTKAITAAGAMQQVEEGKLALDAPISDVLPQLRSPQVFEGFDGSGKAKLRPAKRAITLRHLLTHTAGIGEIHRCRIHTKESTAGVVGTEGSIGPPDSYRNIEGQASLVN